ncbi:hypothetical protein [Vibrio caribbeanicus]|uniref:hypothetical protein n=1 Tax=Vibrio caribbeanicus TaxID=701175 RepID=UPI002284F348|nr:hypothetical protein [Vibrio caribbeanicus]MCY9843142.1 hypothetical protein [Vibrio caribbeanicus]
MTTNMHKDHKELALEAMIRYGQKILKYIWLVAVTMIMFGCSTNPCVDLKSITLIFDDSELTAEIQPDSKFKAHVDNDNIRIDFSGSIKRVKQDYLLDVLIVKESKIPKTTNQVNTTIGIEKDKVDEPIVIAGIYQHSELIDENNNVKVTVSASTMSIKLNR